MSQPDITKTLALPCGVLQEGRRHASKKLGALRDGKSGVPEELAAPLPTVPEGAEGLLSPQAKKKKETSCSGVKTLQKPARVKKVTKEEVLAKMLI